jgi:hypothetical protein
LTPVNLGVISARYKGAEATYGDLAMQSIFERTLTAAVAWAMLAGTAAAQDDKFANCPDPEAARNFVKQCMQANPYNTREVCEERALEQVCGGKK